MRGRCGMVSWIFLVLGGVGLVFGDGKDFINFSCDGRSPGYYADIKSGCQAYHMCDGLGRRFSYSCPNATLFQQRMLICDHWYMVNCSKAVADYDANLLIGQKNKHFVEDSGAQQFSRTPRPDLLNAPSNPSEHNIIYRTGVPTLNPKEYVGVETDETSTDQPTYNPPNHWYTGIGNQHTTPIAQNQQQRVYQIRPHYREQKNQAATTQQQQVKVYSSTEQEQATNVTSSQPPKVSSEAGQEYETTEKTTAKNLYFGNPKLIVNFQSSFRATTPVYPQFVPYKMLVSGQKNPPTFSESDLALALLPPRTPSEQLIKTNANSNSNANAVNRSKAEISHPSENEIMEFRQALSEPLINFEGKQHLTSSLSNFKNSESNYKASTVFSSNFKATTPQYPTSVEPTSPEPAAAGVLPPVNTRRSFQDYPINFHSNFKATTPKYPTYVEQTSPNPGDVGVLPPKEINEDDEEDSTSFNLSLDAFTKRNRVNFPSNYKATTPQYPTFVESTSANPHDVGIVPPQQKVAFQSNFKATTPKYPTFVEATSPNPESVGLELPNDIVVNFHSDFKATTPKYPTHVESTSPNPNEAGLLAPQPSNLIDKTKSSLITDEFNPIELSLRPGDQNEEDLQEIPGIRLSNFMKSFNGKQWHILRQAFKIPEYDFPLDDATRPSYDSIVNSFEPKK